MKLEKVDESWNFTTGVAGEGGLNTNWQEKRALSLKCQFYKWEGVTDFLRLNHGHRSITIIYMWIINNICILSLDM